MPRHLPRALGVGLALGLGLSAGASRAGSITAESIWDSSNAIQRAQEQMPAGATVTGSHCTTVNVRTGNYRYICTVDYSEAPATSPTPTPSGSSAPAP